jgi:hypothetical protein
MLIPMEDERQADKASNAARFNFMLDILGYDKYKKVRDLKSRSRPL